MLNILPKTTSVKEIQKNYRKIFDNVIESGEPIIILNKNNPEVIILDIKSFQILTDISEKYEQEMAKKAILNYQEEKDKNKLKKLNSLKDLM